MRNDQSESRKSELCKAGVKVEWPVAASEVVPWFSRWTLFISLAFLLASTCWAQTTYYVHYGTKDGLISEEVYNLKQDSKGFIWIASDRGLTKFNGQTFKHFSTKDGLSHNLVTELFIDRKDRMWCYLHRSGLAIIENDSVRIPDWLDKIEPYQQNLNSFCQLSDGTYLLGFLWHHPENSVPAFAIVAEDGSEVEWFQPPQGNNAAMYIDGENTCYTMINAIDTATVQLQWLGANGKVKQVPVDRQLKGLFDDAIGDVSDSLFVIASGQRLLSARPSEQKSLELPHKITNSLYLDRHRNLWVGMFKGGAYCYPDADLSKAPIQHLDGYSVTSVIQDRDGGYWFSTIEAGIFYMPFPELNVYTTKSGLPENRITKAHLSGDSLWMIYRNGAVTVSRLSSDTLNFELLVQRQYVGPSFIDSQGKLNISVLLPQHERPDVKEWNYFSSILTDSSGGYYAGNISDGMQMGRSLDDLRPMFGQKESMPRVNHLMKSADGSLWMGSTEGPYRFADSVLSFLPEQLPELKGYVTCLKTFKNVVFIGIGGKGLFAIRGNDWRQLHSGNGLSSDFVHSMILDSKDSIWLATASGINCFGFDQLFETNPNVRHLDIVNALPSSCINDLLMIADTLWAFTDGGLAVIPRAVILRQEALDQLFLTSIIVNGAARDLSPDQEFSHLENNVQIGFQSVSYRSAENRSYAYRLTGIDSTWSHTKASAIHLSGLHPGHYMLEVRNGNRLTDDSALPLRYSFRISSPLWQRIYVWLPVLLFIVVGMFVAVSWRIQSLKRSALLQQQVSNLSLRALQVQMNPHFVYNCLNAIQNLIVKNDRDASLDYLGKFSRLVRSVFNHSGRNLVPLSEELSNLSLYAELEQGRYPGRIRLDIDVSATLHDLLVPPMLMQPFVENAILHGILPCKGGGQISISVCQRDAHLEVQIIDDGIGINRGRTIRLRKNRFMAPPIRAGVESQQSGLQVTKSRIHAFLQRHGIRDRVRIQDRSTDGSTHSGTLVSFILPILHHD